MSVRRGEGIVKVTSEAFLEMMNGRRKDDPAFFAQPVAFETPMIDIEGNAAVVRVEISCGRSHLFTDFILLCKFDEDRKIASTIFQSHAQHKPR